MHYVHITRELLRAVAAGQRNPGVLADIALGHLFQVCLTCKTEFDAWREELAEADNAAGYGLAFERAMRAAEGTFMDVEQAQHEAAPLLEALLALPRDERLSAINTAPLSYQGPAIAELLIEESLGNMPGKPREALALAELSMSVLQHSELSGIVVELFARATTHVANALRVCGQLSDASRLFSTARFVLRSEGGGDRLIRAEMDWLEGSLCRDQRRFGEAEALLERAVLSYEAESMPVETARTLITLGTALHEQGKPAKATVPAERALSLLDPDEEPRLCLFARHNLADYLCELGHYEEARSAMEENAQLHRRYGDQLSQLRVAWVEGKIARGLGNKEAAESHLLVARHGFLKHKIVFDAALVSLELATVYLEEGRIAEVEKLAAEMVGVFTEQEIHREAMAAFMLFEDAARLKRATLGLIRQLAAYLTQARRDPSYAFELVS